MAVSANFADSDISVAPVDEEAEKTVVAQDWLKANALTRKVSFQVTKAFHTRVNKAQSHLELLQNAIEDWFCELRHRDRTAFFTSDSSQASLARGDRLEIVGDGLSAAPPLPHLGADQVIEEVLQLLARMEGERQDTEGKIARERQRLKVLAERIDFLAQAALDEMPAAVQREHEACAQDISELQWHVAYKQKAEEKALKRKKAAETMNKKLKHDIEFTREHCPLVKEKLDLEYDSMMKIKDAQEKTFAELKDTRQRMEKVNAKNEEAHTKADAERTHMARELKAANKQLRKAKERLQVAEKEFEGLVTGIATAERRLAEDKEEVKVLRSRNESAYRQEELMRSKKVELERRIAAAEFDQKAYEESNAKSQAELDEKRAKQEEHRREMEQYLNGKEDELVQLRRENEELDMETEDMLKKIKDCERQKVSDDKNCARIRREIESTKEQMASTMSDFARVANIHRAVKDSLDAEERKIRDVEDQLRSTVAQLQKQIKDEIHNRTVIQTRIKTDTVDLGKSREDADKKRDQMRSMVTEIDKAVRQTREKVRKLRLLQAEKAALAAKARADLDAVLAAHAEAEGALSAEVAGLEPGRTAAAAALTRLERRLDHMGWQTDLMNKKLDDMGSAAAMIRRTREKVDRAIDELEAELAEATIVQQAQQRKEDGLRRAVSVHQARHNEAEVVHRALMQRRQDALADHQVQLDEALVKNAELAGRYRALQNEYYVLKDKYLDTTHERVQYEALVRDVKQLQKLQQQLHLSLRVMYDFKNALGKAELDCMEQESSENSQKVKALQTEMHKAIDLIAAFLADRMDALMRGERVNSLMASAQRSRLPELALDA